MFFCISPLLAVLLSVAGLVRADEPKKTARMVHYTGQVQGVGFRATAAKIAKDYPVTGWVKNLADGRVQLLVEGPEDGVKKFLLAVSKHWKKNIEKEQTEEKTPTGKYRNFAVVR